MVVFIETGDTHMPKMSDEEWFERKFDANERRRFASDERAWDRIGRRIADADALIGQFLGGEFYINVRSKAGKLTGAIKRFSSRSDACDYLMRNRYV